MNALPRPSPSRVEPDHPGVDRQETETHLEDAIVELVDSGATIGVATATALSRFGTASHIARDYDALKAPSFIDPVRALREK